MLCWLSHTACMSHHVLKALAVTAALALPVNAFAQTDTTDTATTDTTTTDTTTTQNTGGGFDWGWLGLAGLIGLAGLGGGTPTRRVTSTTTTTRR